MVAPYINGTRQLGDFEYQKFREDSEGKPAIAVVNPDGSNISGGSGGGTGISTYTYIQKDITSDATYKYYGYMNASSAWCVKRINRTTNLAEFAVSSVQSPALSPDTYSTAWTDRASIDYVDYGTAF